MEFTFENRRILVTGAGRGIGRDLCKTLATQGKATVIALSQTQQNLDSLKAECPSIQTLCVNLTNWDETKVAIESVLPIHGLVNNAGILIASPFLDITPDQISTIFDVNVRGVINVSQIVARNMKTLGQGGTIVNVSSLASTQPSRFLCAYGSSKSALDMITKVMALELGEFNIRVNGVNPTVVNTGMGDRVKQNSEMTNIILEKIPMKKFAETCDVIHPILFLLSDKSDMINGVLLRVDGGQYM